MAGRDDSPQALLARIVGSTAFRESNGHAELLQFICEQTQAGNDLREHDIGVALFGMEPGYDIAEQPVVATTMEEARQWLKKYFTTEGKREPLRVAVPKGEYRAFFYEADPAQLAAAANEPSALERFWMPYFTNRRANVLLHGSLDEDTMLIPEAYGAVQLALLFERHQARLQLAPASAGVPDGANVIMLGTAQGPVELAVVERSLREQGQVVTVLAAPRPEDILKVVGFVVSEPLLQSALQQVGPEWPPDFRMTL